MALRSRAVPLQPLRASDRGFGLREHDTFFQTEFGRGRGVGSPRTRLEKLFIFVCIILVFSVWMPETSRVIREHLLSFPALAVYALIGACAYIIAWQPSRLPRTAMDVDLTTRQRRLFGMTPDPRSLLADQREARARAAERMKYASQSQFPEPISPVNEMDDFDSGITSATQKAQPGFTAAKSPTRRYINYSRLKPDQQYSRLLKSPISPDRMDALQPIAYPPPVMDDNDAKVWKPNPTSRYRKGTVFKYTNCQASSTSRSLTVSKKGLPSKWSKDLGLSLARGARDLLRKIRVSDNDTNIWAQNMKRWISDTILKDLLRKFAESDRAFEMAAEKLKHDTTLNSSERVIVRTPSKFREAMLRNRRNERVVQKRLRLDRYLNCGGASKDYVLERLRKIGRSLSTNTYNWKGGGESWKTGMPTDAKIIMHCFIVWMGDSVRSFQNSCYIPKGTSDRKQESKYPAIKECYTSPSYYCVQTNDRNNPLLMVDPGRENVFKCIALFLFLIKTRYHGLLLSMELNSRALRGLGDTLKSQFGYYY